MPEAPFAQLLEFVIGVLLPIVTLLVLWFGFRIASRSLARSVTPQVECFLRPRPASQEFELALANFGLGSAYNVSLNLEVDEDDFDAHKVLIDWRTTEVPFGIIEPGATITTFFGMGHQLLGGESSLKPFKAVVHYEWQPFWAKRRRKEKRSYNMDVRPFKGLIYTPETNDIAKTLKSGLETVAKAMKPRSRPPIPRDRRSEDRDTLERLESLMPTLFDEMREDLDSNPLKREFILKPKKTMHFAGKKQPLAYYFESHEHLADKVGLLVNEGLVTDITYDTSDRYVMSEPLAMYLLETQKQDN